ncbi:MAG: hypothetical protein HW421_2123 [Ignavibacteria bacterium]|nr:hypothetical protein [Ignavibacteria bacterium]
MQRVPNRLINEASPYLLQHANNPVDWYPWGQEAFDTAKEQNKPVFLSIGYSACHWCHVMEKQSFEDEEIAELMNSTFINIKVDREERPDIDSIYMRVTQLISGSGGWPMTVVMTPDAIPFYAGTYFPKESMGGRMGMRELCMRVKGLWQEKNSELVDSAADILNHLRQTDNYVAGSLPTLGFSRKCAENLSQSFDSVNGGFGTKPKFPIASNLLFLLRYWKRDGSDTSLDMVVQTLKAMRRGGMYDHVGGGFHRYSTDERWLVPHFEKMLYDQAALLFAYIEGYEATGNAEFAQTAGEIADYVIGKMQLPDGGFYSAEDADSEGEEGKFYLWTKQEIIDALGQDAEPFVKYFNIKESGNFIEPNNPLHNNNILHISNGESISANMVPMLKKLSTLREQRVHPMLDDKILTDWNGFMIAALAKASVVLQRNDLLEAARKAADFIIDKLLDKSAWILKHCIRQGRISETAGMLDDYAYFIWGLIELYEACFIPKYLEIALSLAEHTIVHFYDEITGGFYLTADYSEKLIFRSKEIFDGAIPSGNSVALYVLSILSKIKPENNFDEVINNTFKTFSRNIASNPSGFSFLLCALERYLGESMEIVIASGEDNLDTQKLLQAARTGFVPNRMILLKDYKNDNLIKIAPYTASCIAIDGKARAYICRNFSCSEPVQEAEGLIKLIN